MGIPPKALILKAGVNLQSTPVLNEEGWAQSQLVRWKDGLLQKLGGSARLSSSVFLGVCRGLRAWSDLTGNNYIGIGTTQRLYVMLNAILSDITPVRATDNLTTPFTTTANSAVVSVADGSAGVAVGDWINIENLTYIDGLLLQGFYQVTAIIAGGFQFNAGASAIAGVSGGGAVLHFSTANTSHTVTITLGAYVFTNNQVIEVFFSTTVGGVTLQGNYTVSVSGSTYTIQASTAATGNNTIYENTDQTAIAYLIATAVETGGGSGAFGMGLFGAGAFGTSSATPPFGGWLRQWSLDAWGENLLANIASGPIYTWTPPVAIGNVATLLTNAPLKNTGMFVNAPNQQVIAFGCTDPNTGLQDPMLVRFSDIANDTVWTATATNQAGSFRLSSGNQIMGGAAVGGQSFLWTDLDFWMMQYIGFPLVYGFFRASRNCGLYSLRSLAVLGNAMFWCGQDSFYQYDGTAVTPLRCTVWDFVFNNIDRNYPGAAFMGVNSYFTEFFFFFPTMGSNGVADAYVKYNLDGVWDYGPVNALSRSAWSDALVLGQPIAADYNGLIQAQEAATDLDGVAMDSWGLSGWMALAEGDEYACMKWFLPDFIVTGGNVLVTVMFSDYADTVDPNNPVRIYGPFTVTPTTPYLWVNGRGRYFAIKVESVGHGVFWRLGRCRMILQADGKR